MPRPSTCASSLIDLTNVSAEPLDDSSSVHRLLGPFDFDSRPDDIRAAASGIDADLPDVHPYQPTCCELHQIESSLQTLDDDIKDALCDSIGRSEVRHNLTHPSNGSLYKLQPKPRDYFCDRHLLTKTQKGNLPRTLPLEPARSIHSQAQKAQKAQEA